MNTASALGNEGQARWSLRLFGDFQLSERAGGEKVTLPGKRERVLLAYLALSPNGRQPRRKLVTLLWGETADEASLENLRTSIFNLRKALGDTERRIIASEDRDIVLDTSAFEVDVLEFRRLAAGLAAAELQEAAKRYAGDFLDGLIIESEEFESWQREESTRCRRQVLDVLTKLMDQLVASGESERAIETGLRVLRLEPLHEPAVRRLMRLHAESGQRAAAVEVYRTLAESLKKDLGAQPEAETRAVYAEITRGGDERIAIVADAKPSLAAPTIARTNEARSAPAEHSPAVPVVFPKVQKRTVGWVAGGLAAVAAIAILLFVSVAPSTAPTGRPPTVVAATQTSAIALAVLPFANLSTEQDQEFFSDGLTDEISSALAKVPDLRLVARTSAFEFKGQNRNIRVIGEQLGATHLIEGSVRRVGERVRITVQLIRADDGTRVWSNDYDRQLTDIFAIQEEIARAVASSLSVPLGLKPGENLVSSRNIDPELYQEYLRIRAKGGTAVSTALFRETAESLEKLVARAPNFAQAWASLSGVYINTLVLPTHARLLLQPVEESRRQVSLGYEKTEKAAREAIRLDAAQAGAYRTLAELEAVRSHWAAAEDLFRKGLELDPNETTLLQWYGFFSLRTGRLRQALPLMQEAHALEPLVPAANGWLALAHIHNGQPDAAIALLEGRPGISPLGLRWLARAYANRGQFDKAADNIMSALGGGPTGPHLRRRPG